MRDDVGISKTTSRVVMVLAICGGLVQLADCAGRGAYDSPPPTAERDSHRSARSRGGKLSLPGQDRYLPSEDPRNSPGARPPSKPAVDSMVKSSAEEPSRPFSPPLVPPGEMRYRVQLLASSSLEDVLRFREQVEELSGVAAYLVEEQSLWKVRVGDETSRTAAETLRRRLVARGYEDAFIVECKGR